MSISPAGQATTLDAFMDVPLDNLRQFSHASTGIRNHLSDSAGTLLTPLRGAAPLYWAAEGQAGVEPSPTEHMQVLGVPTGAAYHRRLYMGDAPHATRFGRTRGDMRNIIIAKALSQIPVETAGITILDEVQLGDRVTTLAKLAVKDALEKGIPLPVRVIAAEGALKEKGRKRLDRYAQLKIGYNPNIAVLPVSVPLVGVDKQELLPIIIHNIDDPQRQSRSTEVIPNPDAEILFRLIGSMAREADVRRDRDGIAALIGTLPTQHSGDDTLAWTNLLVQKFND